MIPLHYLGAAILVFIFAAVYNHFGHGVISNWMDFAFLIPLGGFAVFLILRKTRLPLSALCRNLAGAGIATLTVGSLLQGIVEIAGTSSPYIIGYAWAGILLLVVSAVSEITLLFRRHQHRSASYSFIENRQYEAASDRKEGLL